MPETHRKTFIDYINYFTVNGEDLYLLKNEELQAVFTEEELFVVKEKIKLELLPKIDDLRHKRVREFRQYNSDTAEDHMEDFLDKMNILLEGFEGDAPIVKKVEDEIFHAKSWVEENNFDDRETKPERVLDTDDGTTTTTRSIFDDIDRG